jgi:hypothetical protein
MYRSQEEIFDTEISNQKYLIDQAQKKMNDESKRYQEKVIKISSFQEKCREVIRHLEKQKLLLKKTSGF